MKSQWFFFVGAPQPSCSHPPTTTASLYLKVGGKYNHNNTHGEVKGGRKRKTQSVADFSRGIQRGIVAFSRRLCLFSPSPITIINFHPIIMCMEGQGVEGGTDSALPKQRRLHNIWLWFGRGLVWFSFQLFTISTDLPPLLMCVCVCVDGGYLSTPNVVPPPPFPSA